MYINFPHLNPIIFSIGPISGRWYGFMYIISFIFALWYGKKNIKKKQIKWKTKKIEILLYTVFLGACIGGRIGYVIFYNTIYFFKHPLSIFYIWQGGMSFHGGLIGAIISIVYFSFKHKIKILEISDFITPLIPFGLGAGRLGNFINSELFGRVSVNFPYAIIFHNSQYQDLKEIIKNPQLITLFQKYGALPRHPSQLYEFFLEGIILFFIIYIFQKKNRPTGTTTSLFLITYGIFRIIVEFFREPDVQLGLFQNTLTMGQILSIPMIFLGLIILKLIYKKNIFLRCYEKIYKTIKKNH